MLIRIHCAIFIIFIYIILCSQAAANESTTCLYDSVFLSIGGDYKAAAVHKLAYRFGAMVDAAARNLTLSTNRHIRLKQIEVTTILPDGRIVGLVDSDIRTNSDFGPDYFADSKTIVVSIPFGGEGSVAGVSYRIEFDCLLYLPQYFRQKAIPTYNSYLSVKSAVPFRHYSTVGRFELLDSEDSAAFFAGFIPAHKAEKGDSTRDSYRIVIRPDSFEYEGKKYSSVSWNDVAAFYDDISSEGIDADTALYNLASTICNVAPTAIDSAVYLNRFINENIRYISADFGRGDFRPMKPMEVLRRKYGDCRDQSALLIALLRAVGFSAFPALVASRDRVEMIDTLPWPGYFNHVIVAVGNRVSSGSGGRYWFFDPGGRSCCDQVLPVRLRQQRALVCSGGNESELVLLDSRDPGNMIEINLTFKGLVSEISKGEITLNYFRDPAFAVYSADPNEFGKNILDQFPVLGGYGVGVQNVAVEYLARDKASIKAKSTARFFSTADGGHLLFVAASPLADYLRRLFEIDESDEVFDLEFPVRLKESISLTLAEGRFAEEDSVALDFIQGGVQAHFTAYHSGRRCQIYRFVNLSRYNYDTETLKKFSRFIEESTDRLPGKIAIEGLRH